MDNLPLVRCRCHARKEHEQEQEHEHELAGSRQTKYANKHGMARVCVFQLGRATMLMTAAARGSKSATA